MRLFLCVNIASKLDINYIKMYNNIFKLYFSLMNKNESKLNELSLRLNKLIRNQQFFNTEIQQIKKEISDLKDASVTEEISVESKVIVPKVELLEDEYSQIQPKEPKAKTEIIKPVIFDMLPKNKDDWESFIGGNLINKIGILITVIGIAIGAKYSINKGWVTPLMRIIIGYLCGGALLGFAFKLKPKYKTFSAVLLSGAIAVLYFITFFAYSEYGLIPQVFAFTLMTITTAFAVFSALKYDEKIIATLGLVGAYAIPFLLSDGSGKVVVLFSYVALVNIGILVVAYKKYWKLLYYLAFGFTWLIFLSWFNIDYKTDAHFGLGLLFATLFFLLFYITFLIYKLQRKELFVTTDVLLVIANSFVYYFIGYAILNGAENSEPYLGLFTVFNALVHFVIGVYIFKQKSQEKGLFYLVLGMVLVFLTIAIPVQLDGNWVTVLWTGEAVLLFWIGRTKNIFMYEKMAYPLFFIAFFSLLEDWSSGYPSYYHDDKIMTIINTQFLTSILFVGGFSYATWLFFRQQKAAVKKSRMTTIVTVALPSIVTIASYFAFKLEINNYFNNLVSSSSVNLGNGLGGNINNRNLRYFETIWVLNYTLVFVCLFSLFSIVKLKKIITNTISLVLTGIGILMFLTVGLYTLSELREAYILDDSEYFTVSQFYISIRYLTYLFVGGLVYVLLKYMKPLAQFKIIKQFIDLFLHLALLWVVTSELIHWLDLSGSKSQYKLGVSILWGVYALVFICIGLWKKRKLLRFGAMALFAVTLLKLFFYDIAHLSTLSKTIVLILLGVLLLIISFLYNKFKDRLEVGNNTIDNVKTEKEGE